MKSLKTGCENVLNTDMKIKSVRSHFQECCIFQLPRMKHIFICWCSGTLSEHHSHVCQLDWLSVDEELSGSSNQISLPADLLSRRESPALVSHSTIVFGLFPCLTSSSLQVRVNSLVCLGKILEYLDKWFVLDEILPFLQQIPSKEPAVLMGILGKEKSLFLLSMLKKTNPFAHVWLSQLV